MTNAQLDKPKQGQSRPIRQHVAITSDISYQRTAPLVSLIPSADKNTPHDTN